MDQVILAGGRLTGAVQAVREDYYFQMFYDDLPIWGFIGRLESVKADSSEHLSTSSTRMCSLRWPTTPTALSRSTSGQTPRLRCATSCRRMLPKNSLFILECQLDSLGLGSAH